MSNTIDNDASFIILQKQISRKLMAKTLMLNSKVSSQQFNHITTLKDDIPFPLWILHKIKEINTLVDAEDFCDVTNPDIYRILMCSENFETLINNTFIPTLEQEDSPEVGLPDDLIMLV